MDIFRSPYPARSLVQDRGEFKGERGKRATNARAEAQSRPAEEPRASARVLGAMSRGRILIIEDEYLVAADVEAALEDRGFATAGIAPDMEAALRLAASRPDLALVDVHLRDGATGPEIARRLTTDYSVPVLFVTANPNLVCQSPIDGVLGVLGKPFDEDLIGAALDYILASPDERAGEPPEGLSLFTARA